MSTQITIYTDYVCPYCLLAEHIVEEATQGLDVEIKWRPYELRPEPVPTLRGEDPYLPQVWNKSVYPMAERLGVPIKLPAISPQPRTDKAFEVFAMADEQGLGHAFSMRALKAFFQEEKDIGNPEVLADLGAEVGLEREAVLNVLANGTYRERHREALRHARDDMAITSVPTIVVGKQVFRGVPSPGELRRALDQAKTEADHNPHQPSPAVAGTTR
ncbi:putative DsbA family dithiol-disulfide isomerase [Chromohalobacter marismortui]|uniref:Putative DsbA family dithiol-disulfide isomerase n=1 Tax=Chromohalobacter marismortui TaxID=42055 RepID=A0A4R7NTT6_9GAMM|nr:MULTISPECIES: DsbA family protein [Chromohalobacter]MCI0509237.1 DsbA family protein [Chromohalobacter sp.]MCI0592096.1 DsbA family protein [Chromohalobacter sp.]TDU23870.1 putative DsbA family dithiol-disulfide isomerase [Chromohalobacter marismortui]